MDLDPRLLMPVKSLRSCSSVETVLLFGSAARGEVMPESDLDVLILCSDDGPRVGWPDIDLSVYTRAGFEKLVTPPTLFAWHLRLEGLTLFDRVGWVSAQLESLQVYENHVVDAALLVAILQDAVESLESPTATHTLIYECSTVCTVVRNLSMILTHHAGRPEFGPCVVYAARDALHTPLPLERNALRQLRAARHAAERGAPPPTIELPAALEWAKIALAWGQRVLHHLSAQEE